MRNVADKNPIRVLVADDGSLLAQRLTDYLVEKGFETRTVRLGSEVRQTLSQWTPDFVLYDLMLPELNALSFLKLLRDQGQLGDGKIKVFVISGHNNPNNIKECLRLGASDYLAKPLVHSDVISRLVLHMQAKKEVQGFQARREEDYESSQFYMHLADLTLREVLKGAEIDDCLHNITGLMALSMRAVRVSIVQCDTNIANRKGWVMGSNDKRNIGALELDLNKYPEIQYVLSHEKTLALDNLANDPTMHFVKRQTKSIMFNSMIVAPIRIAGQIWGILSVRLPEAKKSVSEAEIRYVQMVAHIVALTIRSEPRMVKDLVSDPSSNSGSGFSESA